MIVVLAERRDFGARRVYDALTHRLGADSVMRVLPSDLVGARWSHRVSATGVVANVVRLRDGSPLAPDAVLQRLTGLPAPPHADERDREYVRSELTALVASWLLSLGGRVLGTTGAYAAAAGVPPMTALTHARDCGLPVSRRARMTRGGLIGPACPGERHLSRVAWPGGSSAPVPVDVVPEAPVTSRLLVVAGQVHGPLADRFDEAARRLATALQTSLLELSFAAGPTLVEVSLMPQLTTADAEVVTGALVGIGATGSSRG